jgi:hypothetical protein
MRHMPTPLRYQVTHYDCGPTSLLNALAVLFDRDELPPDVLKGVYALSLDRYYDGLAYHGGTSGMAMAHIAFWLQDYADRTGFPLRAMRITGQQVSLAEGSPLRESLGQGGVAVAGVRLDVDHYVVLTGFQDGCVRVFDPFWSALGQREWGPGVMQVTDAPFSHNRLIRPEVMDSEDDHEYSFACASGAEAVLMWRTSPRGAEARN